MKKMVGLFSILVLLSGCIGWWKDSSKPQLTKEEKEVVRLLNKAFADEWFAYYQYWIGAQVIQGPMKEEVKSELREHALDELKHAHMVARRIVKIGGTPILEPKDWYKQSTCGYKAPEKGTTESILEENLVAEQCAIKVYRELLERTKEVDQKTYEMVEEILREEIEHEDDLQDLLERLQFKD